jgi:hypothetical protein
VPAWVVGKRTLRYARRLLFRLKSATDGYIPFFRHGAEIMSCFIAACIFAPAPQHFSGGITHSLKHLSA